MAMPIRGTDNISAADALAIIRAASPLDVRPGDTALYVAEIVALCRAFSLRSTILLTQAWHETGAFGPTGRWADLNPAGLGITGAGDQTPYKILDGTEAAALHVWTMLIALREWNAAARIELPPAASSWKTRWTKKYDNDTTPVVANVEDLNQLYGNGDATWATDPAYAIQLLARRDQLFGKDDNMSDSSALVVFGRVPHPAYHDRPIWKAAGAGQDNLGKRSIKGVVWHRMLGGLRSTENYFLNPGVSALTDYGIGVGGYDPASDDGVIFRWNDPLGYQSGWASGRVIAPYGDGLAFVNKYGINAVNRDQVSIETAGNYTTPLTEPVRDAIAGLTAYYADQYGIPWDQFPIAPQDGFSFVRWHQEFTGPAEKVCPGAVIIGETNDLIERTRAIMKRYQTGSAPIEPPDLSEYARPITFPWLAKEEAAKGLDHIINGTDILYLPMVYTAIEETPRYQNTAKTFVVGPPIEKGVRFHADYVLRSHGQTWVISPHGTRILARSLRPKIQVTESGTISVRGAADEEPTIARRGGS